MSTIDAKTLELITSKICHDLISPIGAINNGLEIMEEMGPDSGMDVTDLIASSAQIASAKLKAFRLAYGAGGSDANIKLSDAHSALQGILDHERRLSQDWDPSVKIGPEMLPKGTAKMIACFLLLAMECLPKGGVLRVSTGDEGQVIISGEGENPILKDGFEGCIHQTISLQDVSPALTHAFMTGFLAKDYGFDVVNIERTEGKLIFALQLPTAS